MNQTNSLNRKKTSHVYCLRKFACCVGLIVCLVMCLVLGQSLSADDQTQSTESGPSASKANSGISVQEEPTKAIAMEIAGDDVKNKVEKKSHKRRAEVFKFVNEHFPELGAVLAQAEKNHPAKINNAFYRINKDVLRLEQMKTARPEKFKLALNQWKLKTRIEIAIAQYAKKEDAEQLEKRIQPLVVELVDNRKKMLELERDHLVERLSKVDRTIERLKSRSEASVRFNLKKYEESASKIRNAKRKAKSIFQGTPPSSDAGPSEVPTNGP